MNFIDKESGQPGFLAVRREGEVVGISVSLRDDGDIEVFVSREEADRITAILTDVTRA
jgi:hypothetical protein